MVRQAVTARLTIEAIQIHAVDDVFTSSSIPLGQLHANFTAPHFNRPSFGFPARESFIPSFDSGPVPLFAQLGIFVSSPLNNLSAIRFFQLIFLERAHHCYRVGDSYILSPTNSLQLPTARDTLCGITRQRPTSR
ncbi:hypothetical protein C8J56DRAFT_1037645 [Mycena floridula]|nr:hypothetical protein C8J56DRAFT_1037645 [Mycena floridula]